jgi:hypothetical protein
MTFDKGSQVCVRFTRSERLLVLRLFEISVGLKEQLHRESSSSFDVWMSAVEADAMREQAGELFQLYGLGPDEQLTSDGRLLESLIDQLYRG